MTGENGIQLRTYAKYSIYCLLFNLFLLGKVVLYDSGLGMLKVERRDEAMDPQGYGVLIVPTSCKP
jgi:hypothetical protein